MKGSLAIAVGTMLSATASAQQQASVDITNLSFETVQIRVFDEVCRVAFYQGVLINDASTTVTAAPTAPGAAACRSTISLAAGTIRRTCSARSSCGCA